MIVVKNRILYMISLCQKSGNIVSGEESCEKAIRTESAKLIIVAQDASENTKKKFKNSSEFYKVPIYFFSDKEELGHTIGKMFRAVLVITDEGLSSRIKNLLDDNENVNK